MRKVVIVRVGNKNLGTDARVNSEFGVEDKSRAVIYAVNNRYISDGTGSRGKSFMA